MGKGPREPISVKRRHNTRGSYSPVQIREGEILTDITQKQWKIGKPVGAGGFGEIYLASSDINKPVPHDALYAVKIEPHKSGPLFVEMNFYIRVARQEMIEQWKKDRGMKNLGMPHYISFGSHMYQGDKYRFLILKRFGVDLGKVFKNCKRKFHIKTVLTLGIQILDILEYIHSRGYIHADIKASNLLLGSDGKDADNVYLLDYGLACRYIDNWGQHKEYNPDQRRAHDGTLIYTSRDAHVGAHSRRGDLEVLAYNMIQWLSGKLPWEGEVSDPEKVASEKNGCMNNIPLFLKQCFRDEPPAVLRHFLKYVASLDFDTKPDYDYCKTLLRQGIRQAGYSDDGKLNFNTPPLKLKCKKRFRNTDIENLVEIKPLKLPRTTTRQPCVPVQQNCNRMTRQQTAANNLVLRSREQFDWVKVLQSDPEKILKSQNAAHDQMKRNPGRRHKNKSITTPMNIIRTKENPLDNPTPAMFEVLKLKGTTNGVVGKRNRSDSNCSSPIYYERNPFTPAMEEVLRRRELMKNESHFMPITTAITARANRLRMRNESKILKPISRKPEQLNMRKVNRKISAPEPNTTSSRPISLRPRKYSLPEEKKNKLEEEVVTQFGIAHNKKIGRRTSERIRKKVGKHWKSFPVLPRYALKKKLGYIQRKRPRPREVSPSETDFVPRLRSGVDTSDDSLILKMAFSKSSSQPKSQIRHYSAKGASPKMNRTSGISYQKAVRKRTLNKGH